MHLLVTLNLFHGRVQFRGDDILQHGQCFERMHVPYSAASEWVAHFEWQQLFELSSQEKPFSVAVAYPLYLERHQQWNM